MRHPKWQLKSRETIPCFFAFSYEKGFSLLWSVLEVLKKGVLHFLSKLKFGIDPIKKGIKNEKMRAINFMGRTYKRTKP